MMDLLHSKLALLQVKVETGDLKSSQNHRHLNHMLLNAVLGEDDDAI